jgi:PLP dependent protein
LIKYEQLPKDIEWHLVGHLQSNKIKYIAPFVSYIHSVDSLDLLMQIDKYALKFNRIINCLLEVHIAQEKTKYGLDEYTLFNLIKSPELSLLKNINIVGLMGMATYTDDDSQVHKEFRSLAQIFKKLKEDTFKNNFGFKELSMGMSSDYKLAIEEGSTMVRIGTKIFGGRG